MRVDPGPKQGMFIVTCDVVEDDYKTEIPALGVCSSNKDVFERAIECRDDAIAALRVRLAARADASEVYADLLAAVSRCRDYDKMPHVARSINQAAKDGAITEEQRLSLKDMWQSRKMLITATEVHRQMGKK